MDSILITTQTENGDQTEMTTQKENSKTCEIRNIDMSRHLSCLDNNQGYVAGLSQQIAKLYITHVCVLSMRVQDTARDLGVCYRQPAVTVGSRRCGLSSVEAGCPVIV